MMQELRNAVLQDFWLKLFSLTLATLIWFTVNMAVRNPTTRLRGLPLAPIEQKVFPDLPVTIISSAEDVRNFSVFPKQVDVTVQAERPILEKLDKKEIRVMVDLTGIQQALDLRKRIEVSTPAGVTHVRVVPSEVDIIVPPKS